MTILNIPLYKTPSQEVQFRVRNYSILLRLYCRNGRYYLDFSLNGEIIRNGVLIFAKKPILIDVPEDVFQGNFYLVPENRRATAYPTYEDFGDKWLLVYAYEE